MTHERLTGSPLFPDPDRLLFDDHVYDLKWDGNKANLPEDIFDISTLPAPDFSKYLINSVKFHCGQLFYLFDENRFMEQFTSFQQNPTDKARSSPLWFCHYLLILAFGKSFVVQSARSKSPPGAEHFVQAMQCMPDFTFFDGDPIEKIQVLCCAALYLQCVHSRGPAYRMVRISSIIFINWKTDNYRSALHFAWPLKTACILVCTEPVWTRSMCNDAASCGGLSTYLNAGCALF